MCKCCPSLAVLLCSRSANIYVASIPAARPPWAVDQLHFQDATVDETEEWGLSQHLVRVAFTTGNTPNSDHLISRQLPPWVWYEEKIVWARYHSLDRSIWLRYSRLILSKDKRKHQLCHFWVKAQDWTQENYPRARSVFEGMYISCTTRWTCKIPCVKRIPYVDEDDEEWPNSRPLGLPRDQGESAFGLSKQPPDWELDYDGTVNRWLKLERLGWQSLDV